MGFFKNLKQGLDAARTPPSPEQIEESLRHLTPEQRAAYDANMTRVEQGMRESQAAWEQAAQVNDEARILEGPAGRHLYGAGMRDLGDPTAVNARIAEVGVWEAQKELRAARKGEFRTALRQTFNRDTVPQEEDPAERERIATAERAARTAARAPYAAPERSPVAISRLATRGDTQLQELVAHLGASGLADHPEQVFGVYRVADRISQALTPHSEQGRVVEWDIVHAPVGEGSLTTAPTIASFAAGDQWVARRHGEPGILDEDLGVAYLRAAGIGPERSLGLARYCEFRERRGGQEDEPILTIVRGLVAIHPGSDAGAYARLQAEAPLGLDHGPPEGVVTEVLNWDAIAAAVRPKIMHPPSVPSPFPYLPSTPQELLRAYLEVVGVQPRDSYSVQCTVDRARALQQGGLLTTNLGPKQPCADGKDRMRAHGCTHVVLVYRDAPAYAEGRARWDAYQRDILQGDLRKGVGTRPVIADPDDLPGLPPGLKTIGRIAETIDRVTLFEWGAEDLVTHRYCQPVVA